MSYLTLEKLLAIRKLLEMPSELEQDDELMFDVADKLPETSGEYSTKWQGFYVWMRFDATRRAWQHLGLQCFPSHWIEGGRQSWLVDAIPRPEKAPTEGEFMAPQHTKAKKAKARKKKSKGK